MKCKRNINTAIVFGKAVKMLVLEVAGGVPEQKMGGDKILRKTHASPD